MKIYSIALLIVFVLPGCSERVFTWTHQAPGSGADIIRVHPNEYTLYLRQVCVSKGNSTYFNCPDNSTDSTVKKIEIEYLFLSKDSKRVIYITNFPDKYEKFYSRRGFVNTSNIINVNAWYLSKIFIGEINTTQKTIQFRKEGIEQLLVHYTELPDDGISFTTVVENGKEQKLREIGPALSPVPTFFKKDSFRWMLDHYWKDAATGVPITNNEMIISRRNGIYFHLDTTWEDRKQRWIKYRYKRLSTKNYSYN